MKSVPYNASVGHTAGNGIETLTEEKWQAIILNNEAYNRKFFYAVKTTGIFCRPSCKSKMPNKENVLIFDNAQQAITEGFRPCKRCKPTGGPLPDHEWVTQITHYIEANYNKKLTLQSLADICHGSPYHLQRTFKRIKRVTPIEYIQKTRITKAVEYLADSEESITEIAGAVGMYNTSYFTTLFKKKTGLTPTEYRQLNRNKEMYTGDKNDNKK
ncbi:bifunctional transcriptional activator/DNA repair enzyme AdaA [Peribacillus glennii]|nr:bifunctional transcriptional activator/DNA repair enzyme AdaA [Peribacillus glennii]